MECKVCAVLLVLSIVAFCERSVALGRVGENCLIDRSQGTCKLPQDCNSFDQKNFEKFLPTHCGFLPDGKTLVICCPDSASQVACNQLKNRGMRELRTLEDNIIGGVEASHDDFPQFAALAHQGKDQTEPEFICGGVLISEKFVLTAAHCITARYPVSFVRLGTIHLKNKNWSRDVNVKVSKFDCASQ